MVGIGYLGTIGDDWEFGVFSAQIVGYEIMGFHCGTPPIVVTNFGLGLWCGNGVTNFGAGIIVTNFSWCHKFFLVSQILI